ncbi:MAG: hypothetical protein IJE08_00720, partial [Clostridia bacterium]|nr:hypothetical protein [Clostridia bacterium]
LDISCFLYSTLPFRCQEKIAPEYFPSKNDAPDHQNSFPPKLLRPAHSILHFSSHFSSFSPILHFLSILNSRPAIFINLLSYLKDNLHFKDQHDIISSKI